MTQCTLEIAATPVVPHIEGETRQWLNGLCYAIVILLAYTAIVAISIFIASVAVAYASVKVYDLPVRAWLSEKFLHHNNNKQS